MKTFLVLLLVLFLAAAAFIYRYPEYAPGWLKESPLALEAESTVLYKWRDKQGNWMATDEAPPEGIPYETQEYRHDVNILPLPQELRDKD